MTRSVLASVNGQVWDMHRPLNADCELKFLHFKDEDPSICNEVRHIYQCVIVLFHHVIYMNIHHHTVIYIVVKKSKILIQSPRNR